MRKLLNSRTTKMLTATAIAIALGTGGLALTSKPAAAQIHAGVGIGPVGVGVNLGDRDDGYYRDGYWYPRDRVVIHDYDYQPGYSVYETAYPYGVYEGGYGCDDPYSPYYNTSYCD